MENDFEKYIREAMGSPPDYPVEERLWKDMESRLQERKASPIPFWLPFLLLSVFSTGMAIFFYAKYDTLLKSNLSQQQQIFKVDTIEQRIVTLVYDTIHNSIHHTVTTTSTQAASKIYSPAYFSNERLSDFRFLDRNQLGLSSGKSLSFPSLRDIVLKDNLIFKETDLDDEEYAYDMHRPVDLLPLLKPEGLEYELGFVTPPIHFEMKKPKRKLGFYLQKALPDAVLVSAGGGRVAAFGFEEADDNSSVDFQTELSYGSRFSFILGANYIRNNFKEEFENDNSDFPDQMPDNPGDELEEVYGNFNFIQIPFGLKYRLRPEKKMRPFIGIGLLARKATRSNLSYEFESNTGEYYLNQTNVLSQNFRLQTLWNSLGVQMDLSGRLGMSLSASTLIDLNKQGYKYEKLRLLKLTANAIYHF